MYMYNIIINFVHVYTHKRNYIVHVYIILYTLYMLQVNVIVYKKGQVTACFTSVAGDMIASNYDSRLR